MRLLSLLLVLLTGCSASSFSTNGTSSTSDALYREVIERYGDVQTAKDSENSIKIEQAEQKFITFLKSHESKRIAWKAKCCGVSSKDDSGRIWVSVSATDKGNDLRVEAFFMPNGVTELGEYKAMGSVSRMLVGESISKEKAATLEYGDEMILSGTIHKVEYDDYKGVDFLVTGTEITK